MAEQDARGALTVARREGPVEGRAEGRAEGKRDALLGLLARRRLEVTEDARARIAACADIAILDRWFDNALAAETVADVFY